MKARRTIRLRCAVGCVVLALALLSSSSAQAADGTWESAWGKDVIQASAPGDTGTGYEICTIAANCKIAASSTGLGGEFGFPAGVAVDSAGNVYVADTLAHRMQVFNSSGIFQRAWGKDVIQASAPGNTGTGFEVCLVAANCKAGDDTGGLAGELSQPRAVAVDGSGNVYVADAANDRIQKFTSAGVFERAWGKDVASAGPGNTGTGFEVCVGGVDTCQAGDNSGGLGGELNTPTAVAVGPAGVYVVEGNRVQVFDALGGFQRAWGKNVASAGPGDTGSGFEICVAGVDTCQAAELGGLAGELNQPWGIAIDSAGSAYVSEAVNRRIQKFDSAGSFQRLWGKDVISNGAPGDTGTGFEVCTVAANCKAGQSGSLGGELNNPRRLATDAAANVYVVERDNNRIQKFDASGAFLRTWGADVIQASAPEDTGTGFEICTVRANCKAGSLFGTLGGEIREAEGVATDPAGALYVADYANNRIQKFAADAPAIAMPQGGGTPPVTPSNAFTVGKLNGRTLTLTVSSSGTVKLTDAAASGRRAGASAKKNLLRSSSAFGGPGVIKVKVKLTAAAKVLLEEKGSVKAKAKITFTPAGGIASTQTRKLKIKQ